jgi:hypothetical protein
MEYGGTSHNRTVYASPLLGNDGQRRCRDVARYVSAMNLDGTLCEMRSKLVGILYKIYIDKVYQNNIKL